MDSTKPVGTSDTGLSVALLATCIALCCLAPPGAHAVAPGTCLQFETELVSMSLTGGPFPIPLASDPTNALGDSVEGYGFVDSLVSISLSSQRAPAGPPSLGQATAFPFGDPGTKSADVEDARLKGAIGSCPPPDPDNPLDPGELDGQQFIVDSFFDVFFDITVTDVDDRPGRDYAGQADGASIVLPDNGPANMRSFHLPFFDKDAPNFGLIPPPEADPYIGHFLIEIPLGADINGNGENDKIKFTLATHSAGDQNRTFIVLPDGTVIDEFDSAAFLEGAIVDESSDPPFIIGAMLPNGLPDPGAFGGPTTATSVLINVLGACCTNGPGTRSDCITTSQVDCAQNHSLFLGPGSSCDDVLDCVPLIVTFESLSAVATPKGVVVRWTTATELETVGFRVLRETADRAAKGVSVAAEMIPARGHALSGASYEFVDAAAAAASAVNYYIEDIDIFGKVTRHGPIMVQRGIRSRDTGREASSPEGRLQR